MEPENPYDPIDSPLLHAAWALGHQACQASLEEEIERLQAHLAGSESNHEACLDLLDAERARVASLEEDLMDLSALREFKRFACDRHYTLHQLWGEVHG